MKEILPGDWIRFWYQGRMVTDIVQYLREDTGYPYHIRAYCITSVVDVLDILEVRSSNGQTRNGVS